MIEAGNKGVRKKDACLKAGLCACLAIATYLIYYQVVGFDFVTLDTPSYVYTNQHVKSGLNWESVRWAFTSTEFYNWHPVTWLSHLLDAELFGMESGAHHHTSVILHIINTILLFVFLSAATGCIWRCALVALLFALHPLHVESVVWVAERKDVLCSFFFFLSLLSYREYISGYHLKWYLVTIVSFILGLMAKPMIVTLPFLLLLLDYWPFKRYGSVRQHGDKIAIRTHRVGYRLILEKIPMVILSIGMCVFIVETQKAAGSVATVEAFSFLERVSNAVISYMFYLKDTFWPLNLCVYYPLTGGVKKEYGLVALILFISIFIVAVISRKKYGWALTGWLWYTGLLVPVIGIVQVGAQSRADRYTYLPSIGIFIIIAWVLAKLAEQSKQAKLLVIVVSIAVLLIMVPLTGRQIGYWENSEKLYKRALTVTDNNGFIHYNLGIVLFNQNRFDEAITHFITRVEISPTDALGHNMIGASLVRMGKPEQAIPHFQNAIQLKDDFIDASINLASVHKRKGDVDTAIMIYQKALQKSPYDPELHNNLATAFVTRGKLKEAKKHFKIALENDPDNVKARNNLSLVDLIENEIKEESSIYFNTASPESAPQNAKVEMTDIIKGVFKKYKVAVSSGDLQKMASDWELILNNKEK